jgi:phage repressor protein C with HTH and peptisase S24 domain
VEVLASNPHKPAVVPIDAGARRRGEYVVVRLALPGQPLHNIGVFLRDPATDRLHLRMRSHWEDLAGADDAEYLAALAGDFHAKAEENGADRFLRSLEDSLSHLLLVGDREAVAVDSFSRVLDRLCERYVERVEVRPYRTHLPLYSLRAAATRFGEDMQVAEEDWVPVPEDLRAAENMFVAHVVGRSMEPRIPDGSLNVFRAPVVGSRQNKIVLVELIGELDDSARYTIKKYASRKRYTGEDEWEHSAIRLEPLNPEFSAFELAPDGLRVIAEWIRTLD